MKLSIRPDPDAAVQKTKSTLELAVSCLRTLIDEHDAYHLADTKTTERTIFVDTTGISATDFDIDQQTQQALLANGRNAAAKFLDTWPSSHFNGSGKWLGNSTISPNSP